MNIKEIYAHPPTARIYNKAPYRQKAQATVLYVEDNIAVFDKTLFYAESGGQIYDTGYINGHKVIDVQKYLGEFHLVKNDKIDVPGVKVNTRIVHTFANKTDFSPGDRVEMEIDWQRRYKIMRNHSLSHFLFYAIETLFNNRGEDLFLKGCSINEEKGGFSLNNRLTEEDLIEIKNIIDDVFKPGINIEMIPEPSNDEVYYWTCNDIVIPCGGTHVKNTDEIQHYQVGKKSGGKNKTRVYIMPV